MTKVIWEDIFTKQDAVAPKDYGAALAMQLAGWANCRMVRPPEQFGNGMVKLEKITGVGKPEDVESAVDKFLANNRPCNQEKDDG